MTKDDHWYKFISPPLSCKVGRRLITLAEDDIATWYNIIFKLTGNYLT